MSLLLFLSFVFGAAAGNSLHPALLGTVLENSPAGCPFRHSPASPRSSDFVALIQKFTGFQGPFTPASSDDPLQVLNVQLQSSYRNSRAELLDGFHDHLVVAFNNTVTLMRNRTVLAQHAAVSVLGTELKLACHVALATFVILDPVVRGVDPSLDQVTAYIQLAKETGARASLSAPERQFSKEQTARALSIFDESMAMLKSALGPGSSTPTVGSLRAYAVRVAPLLLANVDDYVADNVAMLAGVVRAYKQQVGPEAWSRARSIIVAGHMARDGLEFAQLMAREFGTTLDDDGYTRGSRIIYCEALSTLDECLTLLSTHFQDGDVGLAFFNATLRMHRDLLADATTAYLQSHPKL